MEKENKNPLHIIQGDEQQLPKAGQNETQKEAPPEADQDKGEEGEKPRTFTLPEGYMLAQEMRDLFDEDIVTHVQGSAEPEAD